MRHLKAVGLIAVCVAGVGLWLAAMQSVAKTVTSGRPSSVVALPSVDAVVSGEAEATSPVLSHEAMRREAMQHEAMQHEAQRSEAPHPITAAHARLYREVDLLEGAAAALRADAPAQARALLASYRAEYAPSAGSDHEGLLLLADCIEQQSERSVARVQAFYDEHTSSLVRRQLRKQCLQAPIALR